METDTAKAPPRPGPKANRSGESDVYGRSPLRINEKAISHVEEWRAGLLDNHASTQTGIEYRRRVRRFLEFLEASEIAFDSADVAACGRFLIALRETGKGLGTLKIFGATLRTWYSWLKDRGHVSKNPWEAFGRKYDAPEAFLSPFTVGEFERVLPAASRPTSPIDAQGAPRGVMRGVRECRQFQAYAVELTEKWLSHLEASGMRLNSRKSYRPAVMNFLSYITTRGVSYDAVSPDSDILDGWLLHLQKVRKMVARSINSQISAVRNFYHWLRRKGYIHENPMTEVRMLKAPRLLPKPIPERDVTQIIDAANSALDRALMEVLYATGARVGEIHAMNIGGLDMKAGAIATIGKGGKERLLFLTKPAAEALGAYLQWRLTCGETFTAETPIWVGISKRRLSIKTIRGHVKAVAHRARVNGNIHPHRFRHSFATHLLDKGADLRAVQELLGHDHLSTTQGYTYVSQEKLKRVHGEMHPRATISRAERPQ